MPASAAPLLPPSRGGGRRDGSGVRWRRLLATAHFSAAWGQRMWDFVDDLLLLRLADQYASSWAPPGTCQEGSSCPRAAGASSLALPAALSFATQLAVILCSSRVGAFLDRTTAIRGPVLMLAVQSLSIGAAAMSAVLPEAIPSFPFALAVTGTILFSCVAKLASIGSRLSLERRWAKALSRGGAEAEERGRLAELNSLLRTVDLCCKVASPAVAGAVMTLLGAVTTGVVVAAFNLLAWPLEVLCLRKVYSDTACRERLQKAGGGASGAGDGAAGVNQEVSRPWRLYFAQRQLWPSAFSLAMLYMTVLSFGSVLTAYVRTLGVEVAVISAYHSVGEVFGLIAAVTTPKVIKRLQPARSALLFIWLQVVCLIPSAFGTSSWARGLGPLASSGLLVGGVAASRLGLWGFDLSVSQLIQEKVVPASALGAVCGVQEALCSSFGALAALSGMLLSDPRQFHYLAFGSLAAVFSAALLHTSTVVARDGGKVR